MRIARARLQRMGGRLPAPISNSGQSWETREGLLLQLFSEEGQLGQGEASPLPGYSPDRLSECEAELAKLVGNPAGLEVQSTPPESAAASVRDWLERHPLPPAARFAAETALLDLMGKTWGRSLAQLLTSSTEPRPVPICALLASDSPDGLLRAGAAAVARGIGTLKLKIGVAGAFDVELALLRSLRREVGSGVRLRLDANGAFLLEEAAARLSALAEVGPELIEEPVRADQLAGFAELGPQPIPLAADESLRFGELRQNLRGAFERGRLEVAVLKPTVLGGALACLDLAAQLAPSGARFVVTHTWEGPIALAAASALASVVPGPSLAAGLDWHPGLAIWPKGAAGNRRASILQPNPGPGLGLAPLSFE